MKNLNWEQQTALKTFKENPRALYQAIERMKALSLVGPNKENAAQNIQDISEIFSWDESFSVEVDFTVRNDFTITECCDSAAEAVEFLAEGEVDEDELNYDSASFAGDICNDAP